MRVLINKNGTGVVFPHCSWDTASDARLVEHYERIVFPGSRGLYEVHRVKSDSEAFLIQKARLTSFTLAAEFRAKFAAMLAERFPPYVPPRKVDPDAMLQPFELWK